MHNEYTPSTPQVRVSRCAPCTRGVLKYILAYEYQFEGQVYTLIQVNPEEVRAKPSICSKVYTSSKSIYFRVYTS